MYEIDYQLQRLAAREDGAMNVLKGIQVPHAHARVNVLPSCHNCPCTRMAFQHLSAHPALPLSAPERMRQQSLTWHAAMLRSISPLRRRSWWGWD